MTWMGGLRVGGCNSTAPDEAKAAYDPLDANLFETLLVVEAFKSRVTTRRR
jgi:hypothetical protein